MLTRKSVGGTLSATDSQFAFHITQSPCSFTREVHLNSKKRTKGKRTLHGSLGTNGSGQTHGAGHEVGEDLVGTRGTVGGVFAEVGDLQSRATLLGAGEGALEGGLRIGDSPPLLAGGDGGAGGRQVLASASAQQRAGGGGERHGDAIDHRRVDRNCVEGEGVGEWMKPGRSWSQSFR